MRDLNDMVDNFWSFTLQTTEQPALQSLPKYTPRTETFRSTKDLQHMTGESLSSTIRDLVKALDMYRATILAGGAVRDTFLGSYISDYDVYTCCTKDEALTTLEKLKREFGITNLKQLVTEGSNGAPVYDGDVCAVFEFYVLNTLKPVQLVCLNVHPLVYCGRDFSLDICRIGWQPSPSNDIGTIIYTDSFLRALQRNSFRIMNASTCTNQYLDKILMKYPHQDIQYTGG
jgi:hypothetical protein